MKYLGNVSNDTRKMELELDGYSNPDADPETILNDLLTVRDWNNCVGKPW